VLLGGREAPIGLIARATGITQSTRRASGKPVNFIDNKAAARSCIETPGTKFAPSAESLAPPPSGLEDDLPFGIDDDL
jgi:hypothetical protein